MFMSRIPTRSLYRMNTDSASAEKEIFYMFFQISGYTAQGSFLSHNDDNPGTKPERKCTALRGKEDTWNTHISQ